MPYIGKSPSAGVRQRYQYTAKAGQTTFSGTDLGNLTLNYVDNNFVDVFQNGVLLKGGGTDYTATSGTSVVLTTGASVSDVIEIIVYDVFSVGNFYSRTDSDSRYVNVSGGTMTGSLDLNGTELVLDADGDTSITADTDDQIDFKTGGSDRVTINSSGNVGIGETDISGFGGTYKGLDVAYKGSGLAGRTDNPTFDMRANLFYDGSNYKYGEGSTSAGILSIGGNVLTFSNVPSGTAGATATVTERARINADGIFLLGTTTTSDTSGVGFKARPTGSITGTFNTSASDTSGFHYYNTNGTNNGYRFYVRADGGIYNYSSANYNLSDEREKKNIADMGSHYEDFKKFKFRDFNYNTEEDSQPKKHGVIAQEVELVNSNLVGEDFKVKVDEDGKDVLR